MDFNRVSNDVWNKSGVKLEDVVCQLVYESAEEEKHRLERLENLTEQVQKKIFEKDDKIDLIIKGYFEDIISITQYIFENSKEDMDKTEMAIDLLQNKYNEFTKKIVERSKSKAVDR